MLGEFFRRRELGLDGLGSGTDTESEAARSDLMSKIKATNMFDKVTLPNVFKFASSLENNLEVTVHYVYMFDVDFKEYLKVAFTPRFEKTPPDEQILMKSFEDIVVESSEMYKTPNGFDSTEWTTVLYKEFLYISVLFERSTSSFLRHQIFNVE